VIRVGLFALKDIPASKTIFTKWKKL
jgi:hypothetical protein